ncbi:MAG TPA: sulfatase [Gemmataceae bacterium]|nr:sulfatase [Gemmataceae bacterium]
MWLTSWRFFLPAFALLVPLSFSHAESPTASRPPNIVFIMGEDMGPELGCYGDRNAMTPNMDRLAAQGARFTRCFTHAPVCAPSRSGLITGRYPTSIGTHHMRSTLLKPPPLFTDYLKKAGYTIAWPTKSPYGKTDFNFAVPPKAFDIVTDWTKDIPKQPFFGFYNIITSHESKIRAPAAEFVQLTWRLKQSEACRDAEKMKLPAYYPDTPEVRRDLANYYELVTAVDYQVGVVLDALEKAGIAENTIVFLSGDHGRGLPRSKRWVYNQGIHVPLIVRWPGHIEPATVRDDLVCFLDFAPTLLSIAGALVPKEMQGQVIVGPKKAPERKYIFAARDRMDETFDRIRTVRGKHFQYIRNFHPELPYAQRIAYMELMPTMKVWRKLHAEGKLNAVQDQFFAATKPREELYDVDADPDEVRNLTGDLKYKDKLAELRAALDRWMEETKDLGTFSERELIKRGLVADRLSEYEKRKQDKPPK